MAVIVDISRIRDTSDGDIAFEIELIDMYLEDAKGHIDRIERLMGEGDCPGIKNIAHTVKGSSANIGAVGVQRLAFALEQSGSNGDLTDAGTQLRRLRAVFEQTTLAFREYLAGLD